MPPNIRMNLSIAIVTPPAEKDGRLDFLPLGPGDSGLTKNPREELEADILAVGIGNRHDDVPPGHELVPTT